MSRRLEYIPTGYVDTSKVGQAYEQSYGQAKQLQQVEEDRQRKIQQEEDARLATGAAIYNDGYSKLELLKGDLDTEEKKAFSSQFEDILKSYTDLQAAVGKGVKVGSGEYITMLNNIQEKKSNLLMNIGAKKELNKTKAQLLANDGSGMITDPKVIESINNADKQLLSGKYINSLVLPKPEDVIRNSHKPAFNTINTFANGVQLTKDVAEEYIDVKGQRKIQKIERVLPILSSVASLVESKLNPSNTDPRDLKGLAIAASEFVNSPNPEATSQYQYYKTYMNSPIVKNDPLYQGIKPAKDFNTADWLMMETVARKFSPTKLETESLIKSSGAKSGADLAAGTDIMNSMMGDLFGTDETKKKNVVAKLKGALLPKGWKIEFNKKGYDKDGKEVIIPGLSIGKSKDEYTTGIEGIIKPTGDEEDKALAMTMIKSYLTSIGKEGKAIVGKK